MSPENILTAFHCLFLAGFAAVLVYAARKVFERRNTRNPSLLPFTYFSFLSWIFWVLQYLVLVDHPLISFPNDVSQSISLSFGVMQNILWASALFPLKSKHFSRVWLTLPLVVMVSIVIALVIAHQPTLVTSMPILFIAAVSVATIFLVLALSIAQWSVSRVIPAIFFIHGYLQWIWIYVWVTPWGQNQFVRLVFSVWHFALLGTWISLISEMLVPYRVMVSSTVDLAQETDAVDRALRKLNLETFRTETLGSLPESAEALSVRWAEHCDIFILLTGESYGPILESKEISLFAFEYQIARNYDHGKILVYIKNGVTREPRLEEVVERLKDFSRGHKVAFFSTAEDLSEMIPRDVKKWINSRRK